MSDREKIKVHVVDYGRGSLYMRYKDPNTGKFITRSTGETTRKAAQKEAGKWEDALQAGRYKSPSKVTWGEFRQRYEEEVLPGLAETTDVKVSGVFDAVERIISPEKLSAITAERISHFVKVMRSEETEIERKVPVVGDDGRKRIERRKETITLTRSESTIRGYLATLKAALNWAQRQGLLHAVPTIDMPKRGKGQKVMKGRPITTEEFERMLAALPKVIESPGPKPKTEAEQQAAAARKALLVEAWKRFLRGLWLSGLRLEESLNLWWDSDSGLSVDLSRRYPMLRIPAEHEKGNQDRLLPIAPEFAEMLLAVTPAERTGRVFRLPFTRKDTVSKVVSEIGESAGVKVNTDQRTRKVKYASAHDLRRSFGERWASRVMPQVLMQLMRHESIETTMRYYVGRNADTTADVLYAALEVARGNTSGNSSADASSSDSTQSLATKN